MPSRRPNIRSTQIGQRTAPWAVPGKWGKHGIGSLGEDDKRGMLNYITPEMVAKAAAGEEGEGLRAGRGTHQRRAPGDYPARVGIQSILENDGYDRVAASPASTTRSASRVRRASPSCTTNRQHLDTLGHINRENALFNNMPPPSRWAPRMAMRRASCKWSGAACCSTLPALKAAIRFPAITGSPPRICKGRQGAERRDPQGRHLLVRTGWRKTWGEPDSAGRLDAAHTKWHQHNPGSGPIA